MKNSGMIIGIVGFIVCLLIIAYFVITSEKKIITEDSLAFKEEYEAHNGLMNDVSGFEFLTLDIPKHNPFKYASFEDIFELLEGGTGVIYFGFPTSSWSRSLVPVLINSALDNKFREILYLDILEDRDLKERRPVPGSRSGRTQIVTTRKGTDNYNKLLAMLSDWTPAYKGLDDEEVKRIYMPTVIFVKEGKIVGYQETLEAFRKRVDELDNAAYLSMNEEESKTLAKIFNDFFKLIK